MSSLKLDQGEWWLVSDSPDDAGRDKGHKLWMVPYITNPTASYVVVAAMPTFVIIRWPEGHHWIYVHESLVEC